ncbi:MAG: TonB-dependent receptor, partial [Cytophagales bacterium]|nr:TonB-dependent receptor [Cytophagales bacterium]
MISRFDFSYDKPDEGLRSGLIRLSLSCFLIYGQGALALKSLWAGAIFGCCLLSVQCLWAQLPTGTLQGQVVDAQSDAPLIGATVMILGMEPPLGATSGLDGSFRLAGIPVGRYSVEVRSIGYEPYRVSELLIGSGKEVYIKAQLKERLAELAEVVVRAERDKAKPLNEMATVSARSFSVEETKLYAASINDPGRMAQNFAGVAIASDLSNEIVIRGNSPRGLLWRVNGMEVPNPNHFSENGASGGPISILSVNVLDQSDFFTGAFPAEYGNAISGVFDIQMRNGNNQKREYAAQFGVIGTDLAAEGPMGRSGASYLVNYRYSSLALLNAIGIKLAGDATPNYQDYAFRLNWPSRKLGTFSLWSMGGWSAQLREAVTDSTLRAQTRSLAFQDDFASGVAAVGAEHKVFVDDRTYIKTSLTASGTQRLVRWDSSLFVDQPPYSTDRLLLQPEYREDLRDWAYRGAVLINRKFDAQHTLR